MSVPAKEPRELFVKHARRGGQAVAVLRAIDYGDSAAVKAQVFPPGAGAAPVTAGPYVFRDSLEAAGFITEAVEALMYLGCDISSD